jgi:hypothetical protein
MPRILALSGKGNSGKTTTIRLLPNILRSHGYHSVPGSQISHGNDFSEIFENGNRKIGVTSAGDSYDLVHDRLQDLMDANCDDYICACRSYDVSNHGTHAAINSFHCTTEFIPKTLESNPDLQARVNAADALRIFNWI